MEHDSPPPYGGRASSIPDFAFAFNDSKFSDRVLRIEIMASPSAAFKPQDAASTIADWARNRKRMKKDPVVGMSESQGEQAMIGSHQEADETGPFDAIDDDPVAMVEESSPPSAMLSSPPDDDNSAHDWTTDSEVVLRVRTLHISSAILASKSPFFYKLFSNGMKESEQRDVTLHISASEEDALMDLLQFMYTGVVHASTVVPLLDVLMAAEKYQVAACMHHCSMLLRKLPMSIDSALLYLELPSSVLLAEAMQPLTDAAKSYLVSQYKDVMSYQEDLLNLPLCGIEAVLSSDDLQVTSEDVIYDLVIKWAKANYPKPEERKEILSSRLVRLIRFPMMANRKLKKVLASPELDHDVSTKLVLEALFYKTEAPYRQRALAGEETLHRKYRERAYKYRPVKVQEFDKPFQQCIAYLDLKKEECIALSPQGKVYSQAFQLGGQGFFLSAHCNQDQQNAFQCFGLFLGMQDKGSVSFSVDYEFSARMKPSKDFIVKYRGTYKFTGGKAVGYRNLFGIEWSSFVGDDSPFFIDDVLYLRAELTIKPDSG